MAIEISWSIESYIINFTEDYGCGDKLEKGRAREEFPLDCERNKKMERRLTTQRSNSGRGWSRNVDVYY